MTLFDVWKLFSYVFPWRWRSQDLIVLKFEWCEHRDDNSIVDGVKKVLIVFCVERPSKEGVPCGWGIEICGCSSCMWGLRSLLSTEGILILPMFLLSDGSLIWMWSASFAQWCRVLLSLSIIVKSFKFYFWVFWVMMNVFWWHHWFDFYGLKAFQGPVGFIYVFSCAVVDWEFPVVDYVSFLSIWNWIFWMHE